MFNMDASLRATRSRRKKDSEWRVEEVLAAAISVIIARFVGTD
jgi:hypothetical protein